MTHPEFILLLLFFIALFAGFIDTLAGGGGLITVPALILTGVPLLSVLATNKLQASMGSMTASYAMFRKQQVQWPMIRWLMLASLTGSAIGTVLVQFISPQALSLFVPVVLMIIAVYFLLSPTVPSSKNPARISDKAYACTAVPAVGFYDGFFGPGTGSFFCMVGSALKGLNIREATAQAKVLNFSSNIASLIIFIIAGHTLWITGGVMIIGQVIGATLASRFIIRGNIQFIRPLIVIMCCLMLGRYLWQQGWF